MTQTPCRAGFWTRYAAYSADLGIVFLLALPLLWPWLHEAALGFLTLLGEMQYRLFDALMSEEMLGPEGIWKIAQDPMLIETLRAGLTPLLWTLAQALGMLVALFALWNIGFECSAWRATPGKRWLGLQVRAADGGRLSLPRCLLRFASGTLSWVSLNFGHACVAWRNDRLALHDLLSRSEVIAVQGDQPMPTSARYWLWLQLAALIAPLLWWLLRMLQGLITLLQMG